MNTIIVWVLYVTISSGYGAGNTVVDNIASKQNCEALASVITNVGGYFTTSHRCIAVRKVR